MIKDVYVEITKKEYDRYVKLNISVLNNMIEKTIPIAWKSVYCWYGCRPVEKDGEFYLIHRLGTHCD